MSKPMSKSSFVRLLDEGMAPPAVLSEMRRLIKERPDTARAKVSTKPCSLLYQKHPALFTLLYNKYAAMCSVTDIKSKKSLRSRKLEAFRNGPRIEIRFRTLREKCDIEAAARFLGLSVNAYIRRLASADVERMLYPPREPRLTKKPSR